jgi:hypothetical protein
MASDHKEVDLRRFYYTPEDWALECLIYTPESWATCPNIEHKSSRLVFCWWPKPVANQSTPSGYAWLKWVRETVLGTTINGAGIKVTYYARLIPPNEWEA